MNSLWTIKIYKIVIASLACKKSSLCNFLKVRFNWIVESGYKSSYKIWSQVQSLIFQNLWTHPKGKCMDISILATWISKMKLILYDILRAGTSDTNLWSHIRKDNWPQTEGIHKRQVILKEEKVGVSLHVWVENLLYLSSWGSKKDKQSQQASGTECQWHHKPVWVKSKRFRNGISL